MAPTSAPSGGASTVDGNVDADGDNKNETFVAVSPHEAKVTASVLNVRSAAGGGSKIIDTLHKDDVVRVMGATSGGWALIDHNGKTGFVSKNYLSP